MNLRFLVISTQLQNLHNTPLALQEVSDPCGWLTTDRDIASYGSAHSAGTIVQTVSPAEADTVYTEPNPADIPYITQT